MIEFKTKGVVKNIPRATQLTTEFARADAEKRLAAGFQLYTSSGKWEEPSRFGIAGDHRYTVLRVETKRDYAAQDTADFWIEEHLVGAAAFAELLEVEVGTEVVLSGHMTYSNGAFRAWTTKARVYKEAV